MHSFQTMTLGFYMPSGWEWMIILVIALLVFGKRLPEVGRSLGKGIVEFKKGIKGVKDELDDVEKEVDDASNQPDEKETARLEHSRSEPAVDPDHAVKDKHKAEPGTT
ncbi:MAG: twin-arginine translocase TatA/TatE family subunit [Phycisphaeraceae bacterium]